MKLNELNDNAGAVKRRLRVGRGIGSGKGKTGGRGVKGQKSRTGVAINGFEGGQMPLYRRMPKRGFTNAVFKKDFAEVTLERIQGAIDAGRLDGSKELDAAALVAAGVARKSRDGVRVLNKGTLSAKVTLKVAHVTAGARTAIEAAGGSVSLIEPAAEDKAS
ncbi:50S ribosomal protein L15 [Roseospirillum parvum]|uniref:Large ribosomal subunit protein uL15 n=1 Tax=Roseospirillum parvum TaxID=83401 RepID=A0A1G8BK96_9PROT|nr:50S ribosomal protein L15 [Roseospirillum parvum]SDH33010.1 large subunit ribosomal protein L15 [Roseospirillum parvum]